MAAGKYTESRFIPHGQEGLRPIGRAGLSRHQIAETMPAALAWAGEAVRRIRAGVFWPPAPEVAYDRFASLAPEGLARALGSEWEKLLAGGGEGAA